MSDTFEIPMHSPVGRYVNLSDLLPFVPGERWSWRLLEFTGIGEMPNGLTVAEFEEAALASPSGIPFDWPSVNEFASRVDQVQDLILIAVEPDTEPDPAALKALDLTACPFVIEAIDSTEWIVTDRTGSPALDALRKLWEGH